MGDGAADGGGDAAADSGGTDAGTDTGTDGGDGGAAAPLFYGISNTASTAGPGYIGAKVYAFTAFSPFPAATEKAALPKVVNRIARGANGYVVVGHTTTSELPRAASFASGGFIQFSAEGAAWSDVTPADDAPFVDVAFGGGVWVAVSSQFTDNTVNKDAAIYRSTGGTTWTQATTVANSGGLRVRWGDDEGGRFVVTTGTTLVLHSADGASWTPVTANTALAVPGFGNGRFVAIGGAEVRYSDDGGATWQDGNDLDAAGIAYLDIGYGAGRFVAGATGGFAAHSADGVSWTRVFTGESASLLTVAYNAAAGLFFLAGSTSSARYVISTDGMAFQERFAQGLISGSIESVVPAE